MIDREGSQPGVLRKELLSELADARDRNAGRGKRVSVHESDMIYPTTSRSREMSSAIRTCHVASFFRRIVR